MDYDDYFEYIFKYIYIYIYTYIYMILLCIGICWNRLEIVGDEAPHEQVWLDMSCLAPASQCISPDT